MHILISNNRKLDHTNMKKELKEYIINKYKSDIFIHISFDLEK